MLDFECTCDAKDDASNPWVHEIIEWPVVLVDARTGKVVDEFHHYIKPEERPTLTPFCTELTGITQDQVDSGLTLKQALEAFQVWLKERDIGEGRRFSISLATDGPWDFVNFLYPECARKLLPYPKEVHKWIDLRAAYAEFHCVRSCNVKKMLAGAGMVFEGRLHSGIDDTRNIARIGIHLLKSGARLGANASIADTNAHLPWLSDSHSTTAAAAAASTAASVGEKKKARLQVDTNASTEGGEPPPKSPAACLTPRAMREFCDETSSDEDDDDDAGGGGHSHQPLALDPVSASTSRASSAELSRMSSGEVSVRRVANLRTLSLSERSRMYEAQREEALSGRLADEIENELSSVRKQISLLVDVEGLPITDDPSWRSVRDGSAQQDGSPSAPRRGVLHFGLNS